MNAERLNIACRLVACPKWMWLPGMQMVVHGCMECRPLCALAGSVNRIVSSDGGFRSHKAGHVSGPTLDGGMHDNVPDLDDDLTRLGVLAVVRRAWDDDSIGVVRMSDGWHVTRGMILGSWIATIVGGAPTEEDALQAALQVAPQ
jgi:hypothetical protein